MRVLIIKLTSMGDVIHVLPAITDAQSALSDVSFDFIVEESFQEIPSWHSGVKKVIPVASRRWRKAIASSRVQVCSALSDIREQHYDVIIDAQGLGKSALIALLAKGRRHGFDKLSVREKIASFFYHQGHLIEKDLHAIQRIRSLFAKTLNYQFDVEKLEYGLSSDCFFNKNKTESLVFLDRSQPFYVFLHGTTWQSKEWPEENWKNLVKLITMQGEQVVLPWGNEKEQKRAQRIVKGIENAYVLPRMSISEIGAIITDSKAVVSVDTGLGHLSAALDKPTVTIYGPTDTALIGTQGKNQKHLCAVESPQWHAIKKNQPFDYGKISVELVIDELQVLLND